MTRRRKVPTPTTDGHPGASASGPIGIRTALVIHSRWTAISTATPRTSFRSDPTLTPPYAVATPNHVPAYGGDINARWSRELGDDSRFSVQSYFDMDDRETLALGDRRDTFDIEAQYETPQLGWNKIVAGVLYRYSYEWLTPTPFITFRADQRADNLYSAALCRTRLRSIPAIGFSPSVRNSSTMISRVSSSSRAAVCNGRTIFRWRGHRYRARCGHRRPWSRIWTSSSTALSCRPSFLPSPFRWSWN